MEHAVFSTPPKIKSSSNHLQLNTPPTNPNTPSDDEQYPVANSEQSSPQSILSRVISIRSTNSIGSLWTVEMTKLRHSGSNYEAIECLRNIRRILQEIDKNDRMKFCKQDFDLAIKALKRNTARHNFTNKSKSGGTRFLWNEDLFREVVDITTTYFDLNPFHALNDDVIKEILFFVPLKDLVQTVPLINREFCSISSCDDIWNILFREKFTMTNSIESVQFKNAPLSTHLHSKEDFKGRYLDPQVGDKVEVAWRGKFRLETQDIYQGLAWWFAEVMEKSIETITNSDSNDVVSKYKIRYVGWESRWDKWVSRAEIRWLVAKNTLELIEIGDTVELLCSGANVPGAWLECKVKKIRGSKFSLGRVVSTGNLWVERNRLRLVRKGRNATNRSTVPVVDANTGFQGRFSIFRSIRSLYLRVSCTRISADNANSTHIRQNHRLSSENLRNRLIRRHHHFMNENNTNHATPVGQVVDGAEAHNDGVGVGDLTANQEIEDDEDSDEDEVVQEGEPRLQQHRPVLYQSNCSIM